MSMTNADERESNDSIGFIDPVGMRANKATRMAGTTRILCFCFFLFVAHSAGAEEERLYPFWLDQGGGFINERGEVVIEPQFDGFDGFFVGDMAAVKVGEKWGLVDRQGKLRLKPQFDRIYESSGIWVVGNKTGTGIDGYQYGIVNTRGVVIAKPQYNVQPSGLGINGMAKIPVERKSETPTIRGVTRWVEFGLLDKNGLILLKPEYNGIATIGSHGCTRVCKDEGAGEKCGFIDAQGKWSITPRFDKIYPHPVQDSFTAVIQNNKTGFVDLQTCKILYEPQWRNYNEYNYSGDLPGFTIMQGDQSGFLSDGGKFLVQPRFRKVRRSTEGLFAAILGDDNLWGFINDKGETVIAAQFDEVSFFENGIARARVKGKWGYIDKQGKWLIAPRFFKVNRFDGTGLAAAAIESNAWDLWGVIDSSGEWVIEPRFGEVGRFSKSNGMARASVWSGKNMWSGRWLYGFIDRKGEWVKNMKWHYSLSDFNACNLAIAADLDYNRIEFLDAKGNTVHRRNFSDLEFDDYCVAWAKNNPEKYATGTVDPKILALLKKDYKFSNIYEDIGVALFFNKAGSKGFFDHSDGFVDLNGNIVLEPKYRIESNTFKFDSKYFWLYPPDYTNSSKDGNRAGMVVFNKEEMTVIPLYDTHFYFYDNGFAVVKKNDKYGVINSKGETIIPPRFDDISYHSVKHAGLMLVMQKDYNGFKHQFFMDTHGVLRFHTEQVGDRYVLKNANGDILWPKPPASTHP
ncbi:MAG: WG repeat-containing protein [Zoogloeaceae bacterium]|nr:WG repeat-containing protein [Zoogloeaceae bacterium]